MVAATSIVSSLLLLAITFSTAKRIRWGHPLGFKQTSIKEACLNAKEVSENLSEGAELG